MLILNYKLNRKRDIMKEEAQKPSKVSKEEIEKNKGMAIVAWFIFFVPLLTDAKDSKFVKFHVNQSLLFVLASAVFGVAGMILTIVTLGLFGLFMPLLWIGMLVLWIIGLMSAINGEMKRLPWIGKFDLIN